MTERVCEHCQHWRVFTGTCHQDELPVERKSTDTCPRFNKIKEDKPCAVHCHGNCPDKSCVIQTTYFFMI